MTRSKCHGLTSPCSACACHGLTSPCSSASSRSAKPAPRPAFTLVEVLISILILALGMLGLGMLFPVIIREQRMGSDATAGNAVANNARTMLTGARWGAALANSSNRAVAPGGATTNIHPARDLGSDYATAWLWRVFRDSQVSAKPPVGNQARPPIQYGLGKRYNPAPSSTHNEFQPFGQGEWYTTLVNNDPTLANTPVGTAAIGLPDGFPDPGAATGSVAKPGYEVWPAGTPATGTMTAEAKPAAHVNLPVAQRLYPVDGSVPARVSPQFVWDFAVHRKTRLVFTDSPEQNDLAAVIFVRRIDPRIHFTGSPTTLLEALPGSALATSAADQRVPVGEDINGIPSLDGTNGDPANPGVLYSTIKTCEVEFLYKPSVAASQPELNHPDRLYIPQQFASQTVTNARQLAILWSQMKQPGQKLVDNLGNVYTVVGSGVEPNVTTERNFSGGVGSDYIRVDPPVPVGEQQASPTVTEPGSRYPGSGNTVRRAIWQVCFTPQVPVSVTVFDILKGNGQ